MLVIFVKRSTCIASPNADVPSRVNSAGGILLLKHSAGADQVQGLTPQIYTTLTKTRRHRNARLVGHDRHGPEIERFVTHNTIYRVLPYCVVVPYVRHVDLSNSNLYKPIAD